MFKRDRLNIWEEQAQARLVSLAVSDVALASGSMRSAERTIEQLFKDRDDVE